MAFQQRFGRTWWGAQWLNALSKIDYSNRLPRGRSYAAKGAVASVDICDGEISAKVNGSRPRPYDVVISVPALPREQVDSLLDEVGRDPVIISKMLNRELDPKVLDYSASLKIPIFPARWSDLGMKCSCPDWAVPCKHIAAVIYLVSHEIDGNPFTVFSMRGVDISGELKARGIFIENQAKAELPKIADLLAAPTYFSSPLLSAVSDTGQDAAAETQDYADIDYSLLKDISEALVGVLSTSPPFYPSGDFHALYERTMKRVSRKARSLVDAPESESKPCPILSGDKPRIIVSADYSARVFNAGSISTISDLVGALQVLSEDELADLQPEVAALYHVEMSCLHLLANGAVIPQIFQLDDSTKRIRWIPAFLDNAVSDTFRHLQRLLPQNILEFTDHAVKGIRSPEVHGLVLFSVMLDELVGQFAAGDEKASDKEVFDLFFGSHKASFAGPGEGEIASGIQLWLSRLHLSQAEQLPVLWLEDEDQEFLLTLSVEKRGDSLKKPVPLSEVLSSEEWQQSRYSVLQKVALFAEFFPGFNDYISSGAVHPIRLTPSELPALLFDVLPIIRLLGIRAVIPKELDHLLRPRLSVSIKAKPDQLGGYFNFSDLLDFDWSVAIGSSFLSKDEFEELVRTASGIIQFRGEYLLLDPAEIERLRKQLSKPEVAGGRDLLRIALAEEYGGATVRLDKNVRRMIKSLTKAEDIAVPESVSAELRPYQKRGYEWLYKNASAGFGSIIADDMGLGKTLQVISAIAKMKEEGELEKAKALVVVPTTLLTNWSREIAKFAPSLTSGIYHGSGRAIPQDVPDVLLTSYGVVRTDAALLKKLPWRVVVADEAQNMKNPAAAQTKAVKSIPAGNFIAMSGTPVENRLSEYWSIMDYANRGLLGNLNQFTKEFAVPIQKHHDHEVTSRFKRVTSPFLLRRVKSDKAIISDLPDKVEQNYLCDLTKEQVVIYESTVREALAAVEGESDLFKRQGLVLQMILALKQICNHPAQFLKGGERGADLSGKGQLFLDLVDPIYESHQKVLVFTQFREMGELLCEWITGRFGRQPSFLHGGLSRKARDEMVSRFQEDPTERAFVLSLKAGGTGLNLTAASYVVHFDLWWNPAVEQQATDRAYRIGQTRNVGVYRLITRNTFEERINEMIDSKRELAELSVGAGESWIGNLTNKELREVFSLS